MEDYSIAMKFEFEYKFGNFRSRVLRQCIIYNDMANVQGLGFFVILKTSLCSKMKILCLT